MIEAEKKEDVPDNVASCPPIPGGQVYNVYYPPGMASTIKLKTSTGTEDSTSSSPSLSARKHEYGTQVVHEGNCTCPYCYIRKSNKKKMYFMVNTANKQQMQSITYQDQLQTQQQSQAAPL